MSRVGRLLLWVKAPRALKRFSAVSRAPAEAQQRLLREIIGSNADTEFGRRHGFGGITTNDSQIGRASCRERVCSTV